ncbi:MAG: hypothetical protein MI919_04955, partial [Holophagales bacterium]|nr:hypothetical protein [Holophagales bacterium]
AVALVLAWGPNDASLHARVRASDALELRLVPWQRLLAEAGPLWLHLDPRPQVSERRWHALYLGARGPWSGPGGVASASSSGTSGPILSPGPRIWLDPSRYVTGGPEGLGTGPAHRFAWSLVTLESLAVDGVEPLLRVLLEASLERWAGGGDPRGAVLALRAERLHTDLPPEERLDAHLSALVDYGSTLWGIAHEIGRQERRRRARGEGLCGLLGHPATLFGHWRRTVQETPFAGHVRRVGAPAARRDAWGFTRSVLAAADKAWLAQELLGGPVSGDPTLDFAFLCQP